MSLRAAVNSRLGTAIVTGSFAVAVALVTGFFNWMARPNPAPAPSPPALAVATMPAISPALPQMEASVAPQPPNLLLNFAAFQSRMRNHQLTLEQRADAAAPWLGQNVAWQGYVDDVIEMPPGTGTAWTVAMCEDRQSLDQSLFKLPALCRFTDDAGGRVPALQRGQRISVAGRLHSHNVVATEVTGCVLLSVHDR